MNTLLAFLLGPAGQKMLERAAVMLSEGDYPNEIDLAQLIDKALSSTEKNKFRRVVASAKAKTKKRTSSM